MRPLITGWDYLLLPVYLFAVYFIAYSVRSKRYPHGHPMRPYFIPGLTVKIIGAVGITLLYCYYYGYGDTIVYYRTGLVLNSVRDQLGFADWLKVLFRIPAWHDARYFDFISQMGDIYFLLPNHIVSASSAFLSLLCFETFLPTAVLFAAVSFTGIWALFRAFLLVNQDEVKLTAIATLFLPSVVIWGSGIYKDTICMFAIGWLTYGVFKIIIQRDFSPFTLAVTILGFVVLACVKVYILISFFPGIMLWALQTSTQRLTNPTSRFLLKSVVPVVVILISLVAFQGLSEELGAYSFENIEKSSNNLRTNLLAISLEYDGAAYDLGGFEGGVWGMLLKFPQAVNVTLFRPYLWETRKPIIFFSALESASLLISTGIVLYSVGIPNALRVIKRSLTARFCLLFTLIFAFATGISTYNFGTLSRYKIPCIPFFAFLLIIIYSEGRKPARAR